MKLLVLVRFLFFCVCAFVVVAFLLFFNPSEKSGGNGVVKPCLGLKR